MKTNSPEATLPKATYDHRAILESPLDAIITMDETGKVMEFNSAAERMFGWPRREAVGQLLADVIIPASLRELHREGLARYLRTGQTVLIGKRVEITAQRRDGTEFPVEIFIQPVRKAEAPLFTGFIREITDRKRAEKESRLAAERFIHQRNAVMALMQSEALYTNDLKTALRKITEVDAKTLGVARVSIWRYHRERSAIECVELYELAADLHMSGTVESPAAVPVYFEALSKMEVITVDDARLDSRTREFSERYLVPLGITSMMAATIYLGGVVEGVLCHEHIGPPRVWGADEKTFAVTVANLISLALERSERKSAEQALLQSERLLAEAQGISHVGSWEWNIVGNSVKWSRELYRIYGIEPEHFHATFEGYLDLVHPADRARVQGIVECALRDHQPFELEERIIRPSGVTRVLQSRGRVVLNSEGEPARMMGVCQDITEQKEADEKRRLAEARYHAIFEHAIEGIFQTTLEGQFITANPAMARILGYASPEELIGHRTDIRHQGYVDPERRDDFRGLIEENGVVLGFEYQAYCKDGSRKWVSENARAVRDANGEMLFFEGSLEDITERREAEAALRMSERRFSKLFRANPAAMSINTVEAGKLIEVNDRFCELYGYSRNELIGKTIETLRLWADAADRNEMLRRLKLEGSIRELEIKSRCKSGDIRDVLISIELIEVPGEVELVIVSMSTDITERKRLEEQLRQSQKMEAIGQLAGGIAHDFNNMLTVIQGHALLLLMEEEQSHVVKASVEEIVQTAERAAGLTQQLLTFSRKQVMQPKNLDLSDVVGRIIRMLRPILGENIELAMELSSNLSPVYADPGMMEQVVLNLALNARDAMPGGGRLVIRTCLERIENDFLRQNPQATAGLFVCLYVTDSGSGISPENLSHIFEPFFTTKEVGKGTGLGLATAHGIIKQHHGWINVWSEIAKGTTFKVYLPVSQNGGVEARDQSEKPVKGGREKLLVVEDDEALRRLIRPMLERYGYTVLEAGNGAAALAVWREHLEQIDLVLTDMVMPGGMSGMDLAAKLLIEKPGLKVIFSSGYSADIFGKEISLKDGLNFLQKPYRPTTLAKAVRDCLDVRCPV